MMTRRVFLGTCGTAALASSLDVSFADSKAARSFHLSISPEALEADPDLLGIVREAGVRDIWIGGFFYGHWPCPRETVLSCLRRVEASGIAAHVIDVPLGHPGDSLGSSDGNFPLTPPTHWRVARRPDGGSYAGTSLHAPATEENVRAIETLAKMGVDRVFLDDDFRLARGPGQIGGCFCDDHHRAFLEKAGYPEDRWQELIDDVGNRRLTPLLRQWVEFTCDELTACFRAQQDAAPDLELGIMVMYLGAEKAGVRLEDYRNAPFRVGELMFDDASFGTVKGKTDELFSALFHRRFAEPQRAFSETTAFPSNQLSAANMAAKLAVSTIADVRNTMFMSGVTAFPRTHWETLGPAMKKNAAIHKKLAGHRPRGLFKHFWGDAARYVGDDNPFSLFLASGVPFEACDDWPGDGWTFLADADASLVRNNSAPTAATRLIARSPSDACRGIEETLPALFALKREIVPNLGPIPFVEDDKPAVCAWYPTARAVLLWNLSENEETFSLRAGEARRTISVAGLDLELATDIG